MNQLREVSCTAEQQSAMPPGSDASFNHLAIRFPKHAFQNKQAFKKIE